MRTALRSWFALLVAVALLAAGTDGRAAEAAKKSSTAGSTTSKSAKPPAKASTTKKSTAPKSSTSKKPAPTSKPSASKKTSPAKPPSSKKTSSTTKPPPAKKTEAAKPAAPKSGGALTKILPLPTSFDSGRVSFSIRYGDVEGSLETMPAFVMPGSTLEITAKGGSGLYAASSRTGSLVADEKKPLWRWTAPAVHGDHQIRIRDRGRTRGDAITLQVFVLRPSDGGTTIGDYPLGSYGTPPKNPERSLPPEGFVEVTEKNIATAVSPHFRLGQFRCKDGVEGTTYLVLKPQLLLKLELVLQELARQGLPAKTLNVLSGYRTPAYHARIGNETAFSRHLYGDAADVFLDRDGDEEMDDLDRDGESTIYDAVVLHALIDELIDGKTTSGPLAGGLSTYGPEGSHGPFVHIDTRGQRVRW